MEFKVGDRVRKKNGERFKNGDMVLTIKSFERDIFGAEKMRFAETNTWLYLTNAVLETRVLEAEEI